MEKSFSLSEISNVLPITPSNSLEEVSLENQLHLPLLLEAILEKYDDGIDLQLLNKDETIFVKLSSRLGLTWNVHSEVLPSIDDHEDKQHGVSTQEYSLNLSELGDGFNIPSLSVALVDNGHSDVFSSIAEIDDNVKEILRHLLETAETYTFVAYQNDSPVGVAISTFGARQALCYFLFVRKSMRGKGIGKSLIFEVGKFAKDRGLSELRAFSAPLGNALFERLGFQKLAKWQACLSNQEANCLSDFLFGAKPIFDSRGYVELEFELMKKYDGFDGFETYRERAVAAFKYPSVVRQTYGVRTHAELEKINEFMAGDEFKLFYEPGLVPESLEDEPSLLIREMRLQICDFDFSAKVCCENVVLKVAKSCEDFELVSEVFQSVYNIPKSCSIKHCENAIFATKLLAIINGEAAACAFLEPVDTLCKVSYLQVSPNFRRRNVATAMMSFAIAVAKELGCTELFLRSMPDAEALYRKLGFSYVKDWHRIILNAKH